MRMVSTATEDGGSTVEFECGDSNLLLVQNEDEGSPLYFVVRHPSFGRYAGIVNNPIGLHNLMMWLIDPGSLAREELSDPLLASEAGLTLG